MSSRVNVITNSLGSGDWIVVELNGEAVFSGHSVSARDLAYILDVVQGFVSEDESQDHSFVG